MGRNQFVNTKFTRPITEIADPIDDIKTGQSTYGYGEGMMQREGRQGQSNLISNYSDVECHCSMSIAAPEAPLYVTMLSLDSGHKSRLEKLCDELCGINNVHQM